MSAARAPPPSPSPHATAYFPLDAVSCPSCRAPFRAAPSPSAPVLYLCGHSVCGECDEAAHGLQSFACVVCYASVAPGIPNTALGEYAEGLQDACAAVQAIKHMNCTDCIGLDIEPPEPVCYLCDECDGMPFCDAHGEYHVQSHHHELRLAKVHHQNDRCSRHPDLPLSYYCTKDNQLVCEQCKLETHGVGHTTCPLAELTDKQKSRVSGVLRKLERDCEFAANQMSIHELVVRDAVAGMVTRMHESVDGCRATIARVKAALDQHCEALIRDAQRQCEEKIKALEAQANALTVGVGQLTAVRDMASVALASKQPLAIWRATESVNGMHVLLAQSFSGPCVPPIVEITHNYDALMDALKRTPVEPCNVSTGVACIEIVSAPVMVSPASRLRVSPSHVLPANSHQAVSRLSGAPQLPSPVFPHHLSASASEFRPSFGGIASPVRRVHGPAPSPHSAPPAHESMPVSGLQRDREAPAPPTGGLRAAHVTSVSRQQPEPPTALHGVTARLAATVPAPSGVRITSVPAYGLVPPRTVSRDAATGHQATVAAAGPATGRAVPVVSAPHRAAPAVPGQPARK